MCERYVMPDPLIAEREFLPTRVWWKFSECYNTAPQQYVPAIRIHAGEAEGLMMRWGLIPAWAEGRIGRNPPANVSLERLDNSKTFRTPWQNNQRCIVPAGGFYLWELTESGHRQPYFVRLLNRSVFGLAAVWDRTVSEEDDVIESFSIITVPGDLPGMPAILKRADYRTWLEGSPAEAKDALRLYPRRRLDIYPVSPRINSTAIDDRGLISPI